MNRKIKLKSKLKRTGTVSDIQGEVTVILTKYMNKDFIDVKDNIEEDLQKLFSKWDNLKYKGFSTELGMIEDIRIHWEEVK